MKLSTSFKKTYVLVHTFYSIRLPQIFIWLALTFLGLKSYTVFTNQGNIVTILPFFFSILGISLAIAAVIFGYVKVNENAVQAKSLLVEAGELFFLRSNHIDKFFLDYVAIFGIS